MPVISATDRLRRLLALVPWVAGHPDGVPIADVCERFDCTPAQLLSDLDTVMMVGVHPYTPDTLIDVEVDDDRVVIRFADSFTRPLRLTPGEGVALVAASRAHLATPDADPEGSLARAVGKLARVLGPEAADSVDVHLGPARSVVFAELREAIRTRTQVEIDHFHPDRGDRQRRRIEPARLWNADGHWYVSGWCHLADDYRVFRVDRIASTTPSGLPFEHVGDDVPSAVVFDDALPKVVLDVRRPALWHFDAVPLVDRRDGEAGSIRLTISVSSERWLARTLLQLGPDAAVVDADPGLGIEGLVRDEAKRVLARYR